jgi:hypothetical protein
MTDGFLVEILRKRPKDVENLRTREGFKQFFTGTPKKRMEMLLMSAFENFEDRDDRIRRRMGLVAHVLLEDEARDDEGEKEDGATSDSNDGANGAPEREGERSSSCLLTA